MDFVQSIKIREWVLFSLVSLATILAILPLHITEQLGVNRQYITAILCIVVVFTLFMSLKFSFFIMVVLLVIGANLTDVWSEVLGISRTPLIIALALMVCISLVNQVVSLLPTGLENKPTVASPEAIKAMLYAIEKNNLVYAKKILSMNYDPNLHDTNGYTPLQFAAIRGNLQMVALFLCNGANINLVSKKGETAVELALRMDHGEIVKLLISERQKQLAVEEATKANSKKEK